MRLRLIIAAIAIVALSALAASDAFGSGGYRTYATCGSGPDSGCFVGDGWGGVFKAKNGKRTRYKLCVTPPQGASKKCRKLKTNRKGKDFAPIFQWYSGNLRLGTYGFTWRKDGQQIDKDSMVLHIGD
jgi:hypothetical protein